VFWAGDHVLAKTGRPLIPTSQTWGVELRRRDEKTMFTETINETEATQAVVADTTTEGSITAGQDTSPYGQVKVQEEQFFCNSWITGETTTLAINEDGTITIPAPKYWERITIQGIRS
jgi:hypothetical protein